MNDFYATFTENTSFDAMTRGIEAVASAWRQDDTTFYFSKVWGTSSKDLANLKGRIETASGRGSVADIGVDESSSASGTDSASD